MPAAVGAALADRAVALARTAATGGAAAGLAGAALAPLDDRHQSLIDRLGLTPQQAELLGVALVTTGTIGALVLASRGGRLKLAVPGVITRPSYLRSGVIHYRSAADALADLALREELGQQGAVRARAALSWALPEAVVRDLERAYPGGIRPDSEAALLVLARQKMLEHALAHGALAEATSQGAARRVFTFDRDGLVTGLKRADGTAAPPTHIGDVVELAGQYRLSAEQRAAVREITTQIDTARDAARSVGLPQRELVFPDGHYFPRQVLGKLDPRTGEMLPAVRETSPLRGRHHATITEGMAAGIQYETDPGRLLYAHLTWTYRRAADRWLADALHERGLITTVAERTERLAPGVTARYQTAQRTLRSAQVSAALEGKLQTQVQRAEQALDRLHGRAAAATAAGAVREEREATAALVALEAQTERLNTQALKLAERAAARPDDALLVARAQGRLAEVRKQLTGVRDRYVTLEREAARAAPAPDATRALTTVRDDLRARAASLDETLGRLAAAAAALPAPKDLPAAAATLGKRVVRLEKQLTRLEDRHALRTAKEVERARQRAQRDLDEVILEGTQLAAYADRLEAAAARGTGPGQDATVARGRLVEVNRRLAEVAKAYERVLDRTPDPTARPEVRSALRELRVQATEQLGKLRRAQAKLERLEASAVPSLTDARAEAEAAKTAYQTARRQAEVGPHEYTSTNPQLRGYLFEDQGTGRLVKGAVDRPGPQPALAALGGAALAAQHTMRALGATFDLSVLGLNMLVGAVAHPRAAGRAVRAVLASWGRPEVMADMLRHGRYGARFERYLAVGGPWARANDATEFSAAGTLIHRVPGVRHLDNTYSMGLNALRFFFWDVWDELAAARLAGQPAALERETRRLAEGAAQLFGTGRKTVTGADLLLFAPRFFRSQLGILHRAVTDGSVSGDLARRALGSYFAAAAFGTTLANFAAGRDTVWDPRDPNWMTVRVGENELSFLGPYHSLARIAATGESETELALRRGEGAGSALAQGATAAGARLLRTKASPLASLALDLFTGQNFQGQAISAQNWPLSAARLIGGHLFPFSTQDYLLDPDKAGAQFARDPVAETAATALKFLGLRVSPLSQTDKLDALARARFGTPYEDLEPKQRSQLEKLPEAQAIVHEREVLTPAGKLRDVRVQEYRQQEARDRALDAGDINVRKWRNEVDRATAEAAGVREAREALLGKVQRKEPLTPNETALAGYYGLAEKYRDPDTGLVKEGLRDALDAYLDGLEPAARDYVRRNLHPNATPKVEAYYGAKDDQREYERRRAAELAALMPELNWSFEQAQALKKAAAEYEALSPAQKDAVLELLPDRYAAIALYRELKGVPTPEADRWLQEQTPKAGELPRAQYFGLIPLTEEQKAEERARGAPLPPKLSPTALTPEQERQARDRALREAGGPKLRALEAVPPTEMGSEEMLAADQGRPPESVAGDFSPEEQRDASPATPPLEPGRMPPPPPPAPPAAPGPFTGVPGARTLEDELNDALARRAAGAPAPGPAAPTPAAPPAPCGEPGPPEAPAAGDRFRRLAEVRHAGIRSPDEALRELAGAANRLAALEGPAARVKGEIIQSEIRYLAELAQQLQPRTPQSQPELERDVKRLKALQERLEGGYHDAAAQVIAGLIAQKEGGLAPRRTEALTESDLQRKAAAAATALRNALERNDEPKALEAQRQRDLYQEALRQRQREREDLYRGLAAQAGTQPDGAYFDEQLGLWADQRGKPLPKDDPRQQKALAETKAVLGNTGVTPNQAAIAMAKAVGWDTPLGQQLRRDVQEGLPNRSFETKPLPFDADRTAAAATKTSFEQQIEDIEARHMPWLDSAKRARQKRAADVMKRFAEQGEYDDSDLTAAPQTKRVPGLRNVQALGEYGDARHPVLTAAGYARAPYTFGDDDEDTRLKQGDFVAAVYARHGVRLSRRPEALVEQTVATTEPTEGDLVVQRDASGRVVAAGVYAGKGTMWTVDDKGKGTIAPVPAGAEYRWVAEPYRGGRTQNPYPNYRRPTEDSVTKPDVPVPPSNRTTSLPGGPTLTPASPEDAQGLAAAPEGVRPHLPLVTRIARETGVPATVIAAIMQMESGGRVDAKSPQGALGLMQVMPFHFTKEDGDPLDPEVNVRKGAEILKRAFAQYGSWEKAAAAYFGAIDEQGNVTGAKDATGTDGPGYVRIFRRNLEALGGARPTAPLNERLPAPEGAANPPIQPVAQHAAANYASPEDWKRWQQSACSAATILANLKARGFAGNLSDVIGAMAERGLIDPAVGLTDRVNGMPRAAAALGLPVERVTTDRATLRSATPANPIMVDVKDIRPGFQGGHWLNVVGADDEGLQVVDSSGYGLQRLTWAEWEKGKYDAAGWRVGSTVSTRDTIGAAAGQVSPYDPQSIADFAARVGQIAQQAGTQPVPSGSGPVLGRPTGPGGPPRSTAPGPVPTEPSATAPPAPEPDIGRGRGGGGRTSRGRRGASGGAEIRLPAPVSFFKPGEEGGSNALLRQVLAARPPAPGPVPAIEPYRLPPPSGLQLGQLPSLAGLDLPFLHPPGGGTAPRPLELLQRAARRR